MQGLPPVDKLDKPDFLSLGHATLDNVLGGGIPLNRITHIFGDKDTGKTTFATYFVVLMQHRYPNKKVAYIDTENHLSEDRLKAMGVDVSTDRFLFYRASSTERVVELLVLLSAHPDVCGVVVDSLANTDTAATLEDPDSYATDGKGGFKSTTFAAKNPSVIQKGIQKVKDNLTKRGDGDNAFTLLAINQLRQNIGVMYGPTTRTPGGFYFHYNAAVDISLYGKPVPVIEDDKQVGIELRVRIPRSKYTTSYVLPYALEKSDSLYIPFNNALGEIKFQEFYRMVVDKGLIETKGAWYTLKVGEEQLAKWQGKPTMMADLRSPELQTKILEALKED
jgi:recombination protein RecA